MGRFRSLILFGVLGGLGAGVLTGLTLLTMTGQPSTLFGWGVLLVATASSFTALGYVTYFQWSERNTWRRARLLERLAQGDLTPSAESRVDDEPEVQRLSLSLRRAISNVQRGTETL